MNDAGDPKFFQQAASAARAWEQLGDLPAAIRALEESAAARTPTWGQYGSVGMFWLRNHWRLAQLYRQVARVEDARAVESDLRPLLIDADEDHPIRLGLQRLEATDRRSSGAD